MNDSALSAETFRNFIKAFVMFLILASILYVCFDLVVGAVTSSLTGNPVYDGLLQIILVAFPAGVIMILWNEYVGGSDDI